MRSRAVLAEMMKLLAFFVLLFSLGTVARRSL